MPIWNILRNKLFFFVSRLLNNYLNLLIQSFYTVSESRSC